MDAKIHKRHETSVLVCDFFFHLRRNRIKNDVNTNFLG